MSIQKNGARSRDETRVKREEVSNEQLVARIRAGINESENMLQLWQQNKGFIAKMARKYSGYAELEDLEQEGYIGLCEAVRHYDLDQGVPFINYAAFWIKQVIQRYIDNCSGVVRISVHTREWIWKYRKISSEYRKYYGKEPSDREMRAFLGVSAEKLDSIKKAAQMSQIRSLSEPIAGEDEEITLEDAIPSGDSIEEEAIRRLDRENMSRQLWEAVDALPADQADIVRLRFKENMQQKDMAAKLGITVSKAIVLRNKAFRTLRMPHSCMKFEAYYDEYLRARCYRHVGVRTFQTTWTSEVEREVLGW